MTRLGRVVLAALGTAVAAEEVTQAVQEAQNAIDAGLQSVVRAEAVEAEVEGEEGTPIVLMHGMGDFADNPMGMLSLKRIAGKTANAYVHNVALCNKPDQMGPCVLEDQRNGFLLNMDKSVDQFARVVRADPKLANGFNAAGFSQGNTIIRGYIHKYNNPPVKSFVSFHGVLMGVNGLPNCDMNSAICREVDRIVSFGGVYSEFVQNHLAQANYYRDAKNLKRYRAHGHFMPYINNEKDGAQNATYADNFKKLEKLALVMALNDTMVHPKESEHFGYFKDGSDTELVAMKDSPWYQGDWFGLKTLDEAGKIDFYSTPGDHLQFSTEFFTKMVKQYFAPQKVEETIVV